MRITIDHIKMIRAFPQTGVPISGPTLRDRAQIGDWNKSAHKGYDTTRIVNDLIKWNVVQADRSGKTHYYTLTAV